MQLSNKDKAVELLMKNSSYNFVNSFCTVERCKTAREIVNDLFESDKSIEATLLALSLFPIMKWMLRAENLDKKTEDVLCHGGTGELSKILQSQSILVKVSGIEPAFLLENRRKYFAILHEIFDVLTDGFKKVREFPENGDFYCELLKYFYSGDSRFTKVSFYKVSKFLKPAIYVYAGICNEKLKELVPHLIDMSEPRDTAELQYVYHNIPLLLSEYSKVVWHTKNSNDKAVKLLRCKTESEMMTITESDSKYCQAYLIVEYIKLIHNAIGLLAEFPSNNLYIVVDTTMKMRREKRVKENDIAEAIGMPISAYRKNLKLGMTALSAILFGCDCNSFVDILTGLS